MAFMLLALRYCSVRSPMRFRLPAKKRGTASGGVNIACDRALRRRGARHCHKICGMDYVRRMRGSSGDSRLCARRRLRGGHHFLFRRDIAG